MMRKNGFLIALVAVLLTACGGGSPTSFTTGSSSGSTASSSSGSSGSSTSSSGGTTAPVAALTLVSSTSSIPSDGSSSATITAYVRDANNALIQNVNVAFSATSGGITPATATSSSAGAAMATLSTAGDASLRTITVTATAGGKTATATVQVVSASSANTVQLGTGTGGTFQADVIGISNASLSAGGSATLSVSLIQSGGTLYTQPTTITFSSNCIASGTSNILVSGSKTPTTTVSTSTGVATVTYVAAGCVGADVITATATVGSTNVSATGTVTVAQAAIGSIVFVSATPTNIALKGTGVAGRPESSTVIFQVLDTAGGPRPGAAVNFTLDTTVGGIALQPASAGAVSDAQGNAQIVVDAGTVSTAVRVTASTTLTNGTVITTQSSALTVTTGIPTANNFSMAIQCANIEGLTIDGTTTQVTARMSDRFENPVPDGTAVTFHAKAGAIGAECTTATTATESGLCSVTYRSSGNRPTGTNGSGVSVNGLVPLLATAIGEESFNDAKGDGYFEVGDSFTSVGEPFENDAWLFGGNPAVPVYSATDPTGADWFYDFLNQQTYQGPDGFFHGVLCNDTARCKAPSTWGIGAIGTVILSGSTPNITLTGGGPLAPFTVPINGTYTLTVWIRDANGNVMPGQTTISVGATGSAALTAVPGNVVVPCYNPPSSYVPGAQITGLTVFQFGLSAPTTGGSGFLTITVSTPSGVKTLATVGYTVQ